MTNNLLNTYGDPKDFLTGCGGDISSHRIDDLDQMAIARVQEMAQKHGEPVAALDLACGRAGLASHLKRAGAEVLCADIQDLPRVDPSLPFCRADLRALPVFDAGPFDVVCCQRAVHYLRWHEALECLSALKRQMRPTGYLFLSASGLRSELGNGYPARQEPVQQRWAPLDTPVAEHHDIQGPVCLYDLEDLALLLVTAGFRVEKLFSSSFGNIKAVATPGSAV